MPVARWHYPFENEAVFERQFPADLVCEGVHQTRGWFYALHAVSALLFERAAYRRALALGPVRAEAGGKSAGPGRQPVDPWEAIEAHGADAFRWYLFTAGPPGKPLHFSSARVGQAARKLTRTLWNVYSFFVTNANLEHWTPPAPTPLPPKRIEVGQDGILSDLDRWLLSELHALVLEVTEALEVYDLRGATRPVERFVERLSHWYLRRARRRFRRGEPGASKAAAYATLYETLVTLARLLAPVLPFLAEELYGNLAVYGSPEQGRTTEQSRTPEQGQPESVHLADWPASDPGRIDAALNADMQRLIRLAGLGRAARARAGFKTRQPLPEAAFAVSSAAEARALEKYAGLLKEELNVKRVRLLGATGEAVDYRLRPLPGRLGPKYRGKFPAVREAILALDPEGAALALLDGKTISVAVEGELYRILPEEVELRAAARPGLGPGVASAGPYLAVVDAGLTPELRREALAREFVRRVQHLRRQAAFNLPDLIQIYVDPTPELTEALQAFRALILGETRAAELHLGAAPPDAHAMEAELGGARVVIGITPA
jgi:isoleucyl-tRNA synthetase